MTNQHTKLEHLWTMSSLVIDRTKFVYVPNDLPTLRWTNQPTDRHMQSNIPPLLRRSAYLTLLLIFTSAAADDIELLLVFMSAAADDI